MSESRVVGCDLVSDTLACAEVSYGTDVPRIVALSSRPPLESSEAVGDSRLVLAVPDTEYLVKGVELRNGDRSDISSRVRFELAQSMPELAERFLFDYYPSHRPNLYHGLIFRRTRLDELSEKVLPTDGVSVTRVQFRARAIALGKGYLSFCNQHGGELVCVADFGRAGVSLCLLYRGAIVAIGHMPSSMINLDDGEQLRRAAVNLRTIVNFKLMSIGAEGVTVPIAGFLTSGDPLPPAMQTALEELFPVGVSRLEARCTSEADPSTDPIQYLIPLGLTVN